MTNSFAATLCHGPKCAGSELCYAAVDAIVWHLIQRSRRHAVETETYGRSTNLAIRPEIQNHQYAGLLSYIMLPRFRENMHLAQAYLGHELITQTHKLWQIRLQISSKLGGLRSKLRGTISAHAT